MKKNKQRVSQPHNHTRKLRQAAIGSSPSDNFAAIIYPYIKSIYVFEKIQPFLARQSSYSTLDRV